MTLPESSLRLKYPTRVSFLTKKDNKNLQNDLVFLYKCNMPFLDYFLDKIEQILQIDDEINIILAEIENLPGYIYIDNIVSFPACYYYLDDIKRETLTDFNKFEEFIDRINKHAK